MILSREIQNSWKNTKKKDIEFLNSFKDIQALKYSLLEMIEACIDVVSHIIAINGYEKADTYSEMFEILGKNEIVSDKLATNLSAMARFRNVLVHSYDKIDNIKILEYTKNEISDIHKFINEIYVFIENV